MRAWLALQLLRVCVGLVVAVALAAIFAWFVVLAQAPMTALAILALWIVGYAFCEGGS